MEGNRQYLIGRAVCGERAELQDAGVYNSDGAGGWRRFWSWETSVQGVVQGRSGAEVFYSDFKRINEPSFVRGDDGEGFSFGLSLAKFNGD